ncbi:Uridylate kinase [Colletotrichum fructicola]|uniref:Uridylate kinase n=1 Tax=Colletotrichum aenigma TaxID=1215731 RepID=UPI00187339B0|nr:Uridylate kinase [Colletotrichum aenigma]KAF4895138.1 Uridylate kinase [Colletotrichum fructicola]KAF5512461.1 Uridylate kinase [Colletotrichum aenigma]
MERLTSPLPFLEAIESLKNLKRTGWCKRDVRNPESVSDHMYQMVWFCLAHPELKDEDEMAAVMMCLIHDIGETTAGDITPADGVAPERKHLEEKLGLQYLSCLLKTSNPSWAIKLPEIWLEYESGETRVARLVRQVDKLECLHQAYMYQKRQKGNSRLAEFKYLRERMTDPWLLDQANRILADWEALDASQTASTGLVFVIGGPGVGKGTQCTRVAKDFDFQHVSVGDLLRQEQDSPGSLFGDFIRESIRNSVIVPPSLTMLLLKERIQSIQSMGKGVLIDGFPRSVSQAVAFEQEVDATGSVDEVYASITKVVKEMKG